MPCLEIYPGPFLGSVDFCTTNTSDARLEVSGHLDIATHFSVRLIHTLVKLHGVGVVPCVPMGPVFTPVQQQPREVS